MSTSHHSTSLLRTVVRWSRVRGANVGSLHAPASGSSWPTSLSDGEAAIAFLRILLGCFVGMHTPHYFNIMEHFSDVIFFFGEMQKRPRSTEGSRWRPFLCSRASIALPDGGSARFRRRLAFASSSGRSTHILPSSVSSLSDWGSPCKKINK